MNAVKRIEMLRELITSLNLPAEKAQEVIENEPIYYYVHTKHGFVLSVATITNSATEKVTEKIVEILDELEKRNIPYDMHDTGIARVFKFYNLNYEDLEFLKNLMKNVRTELKKERGI